MADPLELDATIFSRQHAMNSLAKCCRHNTNLASAQFGLKQLDDAAGSARCALRPRPQFPPGPFHPPPPPPRGPPSRPGGLGPGKEEGAGHKMARGILGFEP